MNISLFSLILLNIHASTQVVDGKMFFPVAHPLVGFFRMSRPGLADGPIHFRYSSSTRGVVPNNKYTSGNIVENTKAQAEVV